jgi:hypothetical protein
MPQKPTDFFKTVDDIRAEKREATKEAYVRRTILKHLPGAADQWKVREVFDKEQHPLAGLADIMPPCLRNAVWLNRPEGCCDVMDKSFTMKARSEVWRTAMALAHGAFAVVFHWSGHGDWILHNIPEGPTPPSQERRVTFDGKDGRRLVVQPLSAFAKEHGMDQEYIN